MYLNIGGDFSVRAESVIGVFDLDNTSCSKWTRKFLAEAQKAGAVVEATDELPKSFLVVSEYGENRVIHLSLDYQVFADLFDETEVTYFDDGFSPAYACDFEKSTYVFDVPGGTVKEHGAVVSVRP